jgi:hypothetical protein
MATSPLFGWEEPDDTDLVKDGAAAIRTLGNAIDTSMGDLLGGTTGQVLSKASNTNMDFTWVTSDDANAIQNTIVDAKGDLIAATAADTPARLAVGANGEMLVADSTASAGMDWKSAAEQYPWTAYTFTPSGITVGNGTLIARYQQIGKTINLEIDFLFGSTSAVTGLVVFGLPVTAKLGSYTNAGVVTLGKYAVGNYAGSAGLQTTSNFYIGAIQTSGTYGFEVGLSSTVPFTWGTADRISVRMTYEAN